MEGEEEDDDDEEERSGNSAAGSPTSSTPIMVNGVSNGESKTGRKSRRRSKREEGRKTTTSAAATGAAAAGSCRGQFVVGGESFAVTESVPAFLRSVAEYCNLCTMLPSVAVELGLKAAELVKFFNSRVCQLVLGAGAISVSGLRTITIRNLALALRDVQLVARVLPYVLLHFQACFNER